MLGFIYYLSQTCSILQVELKSDSVTADLYGKDETSSDVDQNTDAVIDIDSAKKHYHWFCGELDEWG